METAVIVIRIGITLVLSFLFGIERQRANKPVGFGTYTFVSVGSCALSIAAVTIQGENPLPLLSAIVTGIGFLGAGALIKTTDKIFGFTSAASIWIFAILGLLIGTGQYMEATLLYASVWVVLAFDRLLEHKGIGSYQRKLSITTDEKARTGEVIKMLNGSKRLKLTSIAINKKDQQKIFTFLIEAPKRRMIELPESLSSNKKIVSIKIE